MKKRILFLCLAAVIGVMAMTGASLAYFTDTDEVTNTFTAKGVRIQLVERQRGEHGLEAFRNGKALYPLVGSAEGEKDEYGLPVAGNYLDKIITVKNFKADAYVRVYIAIPAELDNTADAGQRILHFDSGSTFVAEGGKADADAGNPDFEKNWGAETLLTTDVPIGGVLYNIYYRTYRKALVQGEETGSAAYAGFYLDSGVNYDADGGYYTCGGKKIEMDLENIAIPVFALGVQAAGFADADTALNTAFGADYNPWEKG